MDSLLLVFAKTPIAGTIKTRLANRIGTEKALWIYNQLLKKTAVTLKEISPKVVVFYSGEHPNYFEPGLFLENVTQQTPKLFLYSFGEDLDLWKL